MKTQKLLRLVSMIAGLACFMIYCLPETNGGSGYGWMMIAVLVLFMVIGPASLISNIKREEHHPLSHCAWLMCNRAHCRIGHSLDESGIHICYLIQFIERNNPL